VRNFINIVSNRVDEVFDTEDNDITVLPGYLAQSIYGLYDVVLAYRFRVKERTIVVYFDKAGGGAITTLGFAYEISPRRLSHNLTNDGNAVPILARVVKIAETFIREKHPTTLYFSGSNSRQSMFYRFLASYLKSKLPSDYQIFVQGYEDDPEFYLTRDPNFENTYPKAIPLVGKPKKPRKEPAGNLDGFRT
jgi:hypothetical protein